MILIIMIVHDDNGIDKNSNNDIKNNRDNDNDNKNNNM